MTTHTNGRCITTHEATVKTAIDRGYLVSRSEQVRNRWYEDCRLRRRPIMAVKPGKAYASIVVDLFPAKRVFRHEAWPSMRMAWRAGCQGYRGGWVGWGS